MKPDPSQANEAPAVEEKNRPARRSRFKMALTAILVFVGVWLLGDFLYSRIIAWRVARWETTIERHPNGVRVGCEDFTVGSGETALLLVHGINDSPAMWRKMAPRLAEQGFTCRAMRLPGFAMPLKDYA